MLDPAYPAAQLMQYLAATQLRGFVQLTAAGPLPEALEAYVEERSYACRLVLPQRSGLDTPDVLVPQSSRKVCWADTDRCRISSPGKPKPSGSAPPTVLACCQDCPMTPYSAISSRPYGWAAALPSFVGNSSAGEDTPDLVH